MSFDPVSYLMGKKTGGGGGDGGNPNYVETIQGTLFSPFGNHTRDELLSGIDAREITAMLTVSLGGKEYTMPGQRVAKNLSFSRLVRADSGTGGSTFLTAVSITYDLRGLNTNTSNYHDSSGSWRIIAKESAKEIPCTLTIIHHPLTGALMPAETQTFGGDA